MKTLIIVPFTLIVLIASGLMGGCGFVLTGSGNLKTEEYAFSDFKRVEVSSAFEFEISRSSSYSVIVTADDNVIEKVQVRKEGDILKVYLETTPRLGPLTLKVIVTMPYLYGLTISGASRGIISEFSSADDIHITVSGASKINGNFAVGDVDFEVSGASIVELHGSAKNMVADVSGSSIFNLGDFIANNADITLSGASLGTVNLNGRLDANISGASKLSYIGEPIMGNIDTSGASSLRKK